MVSECAVRLMRIDEGDRLKTIIEPNNLENLIHNPAQDKLVAHYKNTKNK